MQTVIIFFAQDTSFPRAEKIAKCSVYIWNSYDGDSEIVNELARHTALKRWIATEIRLHEKSSFPRINCAELLCQEMLCLICQRTQSLDSHQREDMARCDAAVFSRLPLWRRCRCTCCLYCMTAQVDREGPLWYRMEPHRSHNLGETNGVVFKLKTTALISVCGASSHCGMLQLHIVSPCDMAHCSD